MTLFIGNLTKEVKESDLTSIFKKFGDHSINLKNGFALITFFNVFDAQDALESKNINLYERDLFIVKTKNFKNKYASANKSNKSKDNWDSSLSNKKDKHKNREFDSSKNKSNLSLKNKKACFSCGSFNHLQIDCNSTATLSSNLNSTSLFLNKKQKRDKDRTKQELLNVYNDTMSNISQKSNKEFLNDKNNITTNFNKSIQKIKKENKNYILNDTMNQDEHEIELASDANSFYSVPASERSEMSAFNALLDQHEFF